MDTDIVAVTVYPQGARITRRGREQLRAGAQQLVVGGLPQGLTDDSVRAVVRGPATVHGVDVVAERHPRSPEPEVAQLRERRDALRLRLAEFDDADAVEQSRERLLGAVVRQSGKAFAKSLAAAASDAERVAAVNDALAAQLGDVLARRRAQRDRRAVANEELELVERELTTRLHQGEPDRRAVAIALDVQADAELEVEVSYVVAEAQWESTYDVRLTGEQLTVTWHGLVRQYSGEDWPLCDLRLSTAQPAQGGRIPELEPWYLDRLRPPMPMAEQQSAVPAGFGADRAMGRRDSVRMALASVATVDQGVAAATYTPARPVAVSTDGSTHRTTLLVEDFAARLDHVTAPAQAQQAQLRATAVNSSTHTLLPGRASVFHEAEYAGSTWLEVWSPGEEVELALGVDDRVRVERELVRRGAGKVPIGRTRHQNLAYKITVGNYGPRPANVTVLDRVPVSRDEGIVVRDLRYDPQPVEVELGKVTWKLSVEPGATAEITFGFRVDLAKDVEVTGLPS